MHTAESKQSVLERIRIQNDSENEKHEWNNRNISETTILKLENRHSKSEQTKIRTTSQFTTYSKDEKLFSMNLHPGKQSLNRY